MTHKVLHATRIEFLPALPAELAVGAKLTRRIKLVCPFGCNLKGESVRVTVDDEDGGFSLSLTTFRSQSNETAETTITVPADAEELSLRLFFDGAEGEVADHAPCEAGFELPVGADPEVTLAVWGLPSPIVLGERFRFNVGAKSSAGLSLAGHTIEIRDEQDAKLLEILLGEAPWPGADDLYWSEVEVTAPSTVTRANWCASFRYVGTSPADPAPPYRFGFSTIPAPTNALTVHVLDSESGAPIPGAEIRLRTCETGVRATIAGCTSDTGVALLTVPKGRFDVIAWKANYIIEPTTVAVPEIDDLTLSAKLYSSKKPAKVWM